MNNFEKLYEKFPNLKAFKEEIARRNQENAYDELANSYIRERYTESQEFAILRQRDTKKKEFQEYFDYCEQCKAKAKMGVDKADNM